MNSKLYKVIGLMSGTSLDGLDIAACVFSEDEKGWHYEIAAADCISYDDKWKKELENAISLSGEDLLKLHRRYGFFLGEEVLKFIRKNNFKPDLVSSHGHTIFHEPDNQFNFQLGEGAAIYAAAGVPVVSDFRSLDICLGGQGAPLVPIGDKLLFAEYEYCLNLGGIANISYEVNAKRLAYDISPCNILLNYLAEQEGKPYDDGGKMAASGTVNKELFASLNLWDYYTADPPKSLDKEQLLKYFLPLLKFNDQSDPSGPDRSLRQNDLMTTVVEHIAYQIGKSIEKKGKMLATGGGAFNDYLVRRIRAHSKAEVVVPNEKLVSFKEALVFAFLGLLRMLNRSNSLSSVTGASKDNSGGAIWG